LPLFILVSILVKKNFIDKSGQ